MLHFIVEITYTVPFSQVEPVVAAHRAYLQTGYERGWLLMSGPQNPRVGGMVVARAPSRADIEEFFRGDPYQVNKVAAYRIVEFNPALRQAWMQEWCTA